MRQILAAVLKDERGLAAIERWIIRAMLAVALVGVVIAYGIRMGGISGGISDLLGSR
jgi:Flp pilus assembly pilin Flp